MSGFLRTVRDLGQNFFACLSTIAGREAFAVLEKGGSVKEGWGRQLRCLATSWYQGKGPEFIPWGVGRVTERGTLLSETAYFLCSTAFGSHALQA